MKTARLRRLLDEAAAAAAPYEAELAGLAERELAETGVAAARAFSSLATVHMTAAAPEWSPPEPDELLPVDEFGRRLRNRFDPVRAALVAELMTPVLGAVGVEFDVTNPFVANVLGKTGAQIAAIAETTRQEIMAVIAQAYEDGLSVRDTASEIRRFMRDSAAERATVIARTEFAGLQNGSSVAAVQVVSEATGEAYYKTWLTAPGAKFPRHEDYDGLDGQTVPLDGYFDVGDAQLAYPGDPDGDPEETINCRCTVVYTTDAAELTAGAVAPSEVVNARAKRRRRERARNAMAGERPALAAAPALQEAATSTGADTVVTVESSETLADVSVMPPTQASMLAWEATLLVEGVETDDGRMIEDGATSWRDLPLSLGAMLDTPHADVVMESRVCGRIDRIWRDGNRVMGAGVFDDSEFGANVARMVGDGTLRGISVDLAVREYEFRGPTPDEDDDLLDQIEGMQEVVYVVLDGQIGAATVCPFPAFADTSIALTADATWTATRQSGMVVVAEEPDGALTAAAPVVPPASWFTKPSLDGPTPLTVTDDGQVYGHAAVWEVAGEPACHIGIAGECVSPPRSLADYSFFHLGTVLVDSGERVPCGQVTLGTGHASLRLAREAAVEHYDDTGTAVADVTAGEDQHGIWVAGAIRPDVTDERLRELRAAKLSGDWRRVNGNLELVALLAVNVPGFPVPAGRVVTEEDVAVAAALVAAGVVDAASAGGGGEQTEAEISALAARAQGGMDGLLELARA